uniref:Serpentine receptor class gamma n=1 Tax=Panagrellus redivivus TaxID=6233 RepID=A0A7E4ZYP9_PANRE
MKHEDYWIRYFPLVIALALLVPFVVLWPLLLSKTSTMLFNLEHDDVYIFVQEELMGYPKWYISLAFAIFYATIGITSLSINVVCMCKLREQRTELGLIVVSFGDTVATTLMVIIHLVLYVFEVQDLYYDPLYETMFLQIPWVVDIFRFSRPLLLIFMSKSVKEAFMQPFKAVTKVSKVTVLSMSLQAHKS